MSVTTSSSSAVTPTNTPVAQHVTRLLRGIGRPPVMSVSGTQFAGRNGTWIMGLADGTKVFAKKFNPNASSHNALSRSKAFSSFARNNPDHAPASPALIADDENEGILLFDYCAGTSLAHLIVKDSLPTGFAASAGTLLARLHSAPLEGVDIGSSVLPVQTLRHGVPHTRYVDFTLAELSLYATLQADEELIQAVEKLKAGEDSHRSAAIHGDLRWDQFHQAGSELKLLDWEDFCVGDPARDLGTLAGEWIYRAILDVVTTRGGVSTPPEIFDEDTATALIAERLSAVVPQIKEFWFSYRQNAKVYDQELPIRTTAQLGWHLVDRSMARAAMVSKLPGIERAAAGIGRRALLNPAIYSASLGFGKD